MRQPGQTMRFNDLELGLMKAVFADNEDILFAVRKVLLQGSLNAYEVNLIEQIVNPSVYELLKKTFLPEIDYDAPIFQLGDMQNGLQNDMKTLGVDAMAPLFEAKKLEIAYLKQQFDVLKDINVVHTAAITLSELNEIKEDAYSTYVRITARNYLLSYIDTNIQVLKNLAGRKEESVEETKEKLQKNSSK